MNKKSLLLLSLLVLSACGGNSNSSKVSNSSLESVISSSETTSIVQSSSSSSSSSSPISYPYSEDLESYMFARLDGGLYVEQVHYLSEIKNGNSATNYVMYLDYQVIDGKYSYQKYAPNYYENEDSLNKIARNRLYETNQYSNINGYLAENYLSLANKVATKIVKDEYALKINYEESGYSNMFKLLSPSNFTKSSSLTYDLDLTTLSDLQIKTIGYNLHGKNLPTLLSFSLETDGYNIVGYNAEFEYFSASRILNYKFDAKIVSYGNNSKTNSKFLSPIKGEVDSNLNSFNQRLTNDSYAESTTLYKLTASGNKTYQSDYYIERDKDVILYNESYYYYRDDEGYLFNVREISDKGYFDNESPISVLDNPTHLEFSNLTLDSNGNNTYSYTKGSSKCKYVDLSNYCFLYSGEVEKATFSFANNEITIESNVVINSENYVLVTHITKIGNIDHPFSKDDVQKDGSNLTFSDLFFDIQNLALLQDYAGGEELLNSIPTLGGYHNSPSVEVGLDPTDDITLQFTYYLLDLYSCDFDGCGSISEYDYAIVLAYLDDVISKYAAKYNSDFFTVTDEGNRSYSAYSNETFLKDDITHRLEIEFYIGYYEYEFYLVINATFKPIRHSVTFDFMCSEIENKTFQIKEGDVPSVHVTNREGYAFMGWYKDKRLTQKVDPLPRIFSDVTFYAKWESRDDVTITFDLNYPNAPSATSIVVPYNSYLEEIPTPTRSGYSFYAWAIDAEASAPALFYNEPVTSNMRVYAVWVKE